MHIYNRQLTASEIQAVYAAGSAGVCKDTASIEGLLTLVESLGLPYSIEKALLASVLNAQKSLEKGNAGAAINQIEAFVNKVGAQSGKKIPREYAAMLIKYANNVMALLS